MDFDTATLSPLERYQLISTGVTPRPIAWISTRSANGIDNLAPYSFFNGVSCTPPVLMYSQVTPRDGQDKDTLTNLLATNECVIHIVTQQLAEQMNLSCANLPSEESEFEFAKLATRPSKTVAPLTLKESLVSYECTLRDVIRIGEGAGSGSLVLLDVKLVAVDDSLLTTEEGQPQSAKIDQHKLNSVGKMGGDLYTLTQNMFELQRP